MGVAIVASIGTHTHIRVAVAVVLAPALAVGVFEKPSSKPYAVRATEFAKNATEMAATTV